MVERWDVWRAGTRGTVGQQEASGQQGMAKDSSWQQGMAKGTHLSLLPIVTLTLRLPPCRAPPPPPPPMCLGAAPPLCTPPPRVAYWSGRAGRQSRQK